MPKYWATISQIAKFEHKVLTHWIPIANWSGGCTSDQQILIKKKFKLK